MLDEDSLLLRLRARLTDGQRIRIIDYFRLMDSRGDGRCAKHVTRAVHVSIPCATHCAKSCHSVNLTDFVSALERFGVHTNVKAARSLFDRMVTGRDDIGVRDLQRHIWGRGVSSPARVAVATLAVRSGLMLAKTECVKRARNSTFSDKNIRRNHGADRFDFAGVEDGETPFFQQGDHRFDSVCGQDLNPRRQIISKRIPK